MELGVTAIDPRTFFRRWRRGGGSFFLRDAGAGSAGGCLQGLPTAFVEQILAVVGVPVILQRQVPPVQVVHVLEGFSSSTECGPSCCAARTVEIPQVQLLEQGCGLARCGATTVVDVP